MFSINNMAQMSCNSIEQSKIRTIYSKERRNKMPTQAIPPPSQWRLWGQDLRICRQDPRVLKCAGGFWQSAKKWQFGPEVIKACGEGGLPLSRGRFIAEATSSVRSANKEQRTEADHSSSKWTKSLCYFPTENSAAFCLYIQHLNADWAYFSRQRKKPFRHLYSYV